MKDNYNITNINLPDGNDTHLIFFSTIFEYKDMWYRATVASENNTVIKGDISDRYFVLTQCINGTFFMKIRRDIEGNWLLPESEGYISYELLYKIGVAIDKVESKK